MEQPIRRRPRRRKKKTPNAKQLLIAGCVIGAVALIIAACIVFSNPGGDGEDSVVPTAHDRSPLTELTVNGLSRDGEMMVVDTSWMDVAFPYAFSDLIQVEAINQEKMAGLEFRAKINGANRKIYTIWFNSTEGQSVGTYDLNDGEAPVTVTVSFYDPDTELEGDDRVTFYATQETFNDVLASMKNDGDFSVNT